MTSKKILDTATASLRKQVFESATSDELKKYGLSREVDVSKWTAEERDSRLYELVMRFIAGMPEKQITRLLLDAEALKVEHTASETSFDFLTEEEKKS